MIIAKKTVNLVRAFMKDESGLAAVEYGLLAAGIAIGLWTALSSIGGSLGLIYGSVQTDLSAAAPAGGG